jgi:hypothetical protein
MVFTIAFVNDPLGATVHDDNDDDDDDDDLGSNPLFHILRLGVGGFRFVNDDRTETRCRCDENGFLGPRRLREIS